jgi:hypothetical protein
MNDRLSEERKQERQDIVSQTDKDAYPYNVNETYVRSSNEVSIGEIKHQLKKESTHKKQQLLDFDQKRDSKSMSMFNINQMGRQSVE